MGIQHYQSKTKMKSNMRLPAEIGPTCEMILPGKAPFVGNFRSKHLPSSST
jgi:hypothetical protein